MKLLCMRSPYFPGIWDPCGHTGLRKAPHIITPCHACPCSFHLSLWTTVSTPTQRFCRHSCASRPGVDSACSTQAWSRTPRMAARLEYLHCCLFLGRKDTKDTQSISKVGPNLRKAKAGLSWHGPPMLNVHDAKSTPPFKGLEGSVFGNRTMQDGGDS